MSTRTVLKRELVLITALTLATAGIAAGQQRGSRNSNQLAQQSKTDAAEVMFRSGRDLITDQEWAKAQEKFSQFISAYPNDKNVDAALYWMAYAQNKQGKTELCRETLTQLLEKYQNTTWREDARLLLAQTMAGLAVTPRPAVAVGEGAGVGVGVGPAPFAIAGPPGSAAVWALEPNENVADDDP